MIQNLIWAVGYNLIALPLAAGVLYNQGYSFKPGSRCRINDRKHRRGSN